MTKEHDDMEMLELSDESLEDVVGGLNQLQKIFIERFAREAMSEGLTLEEAIYKAQHPLVGSSYFNDEMIQYMSEYWNTVEVE